MSSNMRSMAKTPRQKIQVEAVQLAADLTQGRVQAHNDAEHIKTQNRIDELERKMKETEERLEKGFQGKLDIVQEELRQKGKQIDSLNGLIEDMKTEMKQLNKQIEQLSKDCDGLRQSLAEKEKILEKSNQDKETIQRALDLKTKELVKSEEDRKRLQVLLDEKTNTLQDFMGAMGSIMERMKISDIGDEAKNTKEENNKESKGAQVAK